MRNIFNRNCCDGIYNSFDVHFTSSCQFKCAHCVDLKYQGLKIATPDVNAICQTISINERGYDDVLFLGGEPCLYLHKLIECVERIKIETNLKVYVTTAVPDICWRDYDSFVHLLEIVDGINLSVQHYQEEIADRIRKTKSNFNRQTFYNQLPYKEKIRINLNIVKPYLFTKYDISNCLRHYDSMGFNEIKLSEIQHGTDYFVSFEEEFGIKLGSPYYDGCQKYLDMEKILPGFKTPVLLKRSCFLCEDTLKASFMDGVKSIYRFIFPAKNKYGVIYENGMLTKGWI